VSDLAAEHSVELIAQRLQIDVTDGNDGGGSDRKELLCQSRISLRVIAASPA